MLRRPDDQKGWQKEEPKAEEPVVAVNQAIEPVEEEPKEVAEEKPTEAPKAVKKPVSRRKPKKAE